MADFTAQPPLELICIVDSDSAVRDSIEAFMQVLGHPAQAFETAQSLQLDWPQLNARCVLCAAELTDAPGVELFRWLQNQGSQAAFALSVSSHQRTLIAAARRAGIEHILHKPLLRSNELIRFVGTQLH